MTAPTRPAILRTALAAGGLALAFLLGYGSHAMLSGQEGHDRDAGHAQRLSAPGPVDIGFCRDMAVHHDQAILMSVLAQGRAGPTVKAMADAILLGQAMQIGTMRGWLKLWRAPATPTDGMRWMGGHGGAHGHTPAQEPGDAAMPGMASAQELHALWAASGDTFDTLFLQLMLRHHQGGVDMARHAAEHAGSAEVRDIATAMMREQVEEIAQMQLLLGHQGVAPLPYPG